MSNESRVIDFAKPGGDDAADLLGLIGITADGTDRFRAASPVLRGRRNIFGGQVMAQALAAAAKTVGDDRPPHSLHGYFLREGAFNEDVVFDVDRTRDGRSFSVRRVAAQQGRGQIFVAAASFQVPEPGRSLETPIPQVRPAPPGDWVDPVRERHSSVGIDLDVCVDTPDAHGFWARTRGEVPDDPVTNGSIVAYLSDMGAGGVAATAVGLGIDLHDGTGPIMASLDHAIWYHRPVRCDGWLLVHAAPVSSSGSRGLVRGTVHDEGGRHVASFAQELLVRER